MILTIDIAGKEFQVTRDPSPKLDQQGEQRFNKESGLPMWATQVVVTDEDGGEIITIGTNGEKPDFGVGDLVEPVDLVAIPWATNGRSGVAFKASRIILAPELKDET